MISDGPMPSMLEGKEVKLLNTGNGVTGSVLATDAQVQDIREIMSGWKVQVSAIE